MKVKILVVILAVAVFTMLIVGSNDEMALLYNSWLEGKPKGLVRIHISIPPVNATECYVHVRRFPTQFNPTSNGYTELVHEGKTKPGNTIIAKNYINLIQVSLESENGEIRPIYDSPEYYIVAVCIESNETYYTFAGAVKSLIKKPVNDIEVKVKLEKVKAKNNRGGVNNRSSTSVKQYGTLYGATLSYYFSPDTCLINVNWDGRQLDGYSSCTARTALTRLYSIYGLKTAFGVTGPDTAMYLEQWSAVCAWFWPVYPCPPDAWRSAGKKLTIAQASYETDFISNGYVGVVWGVVKYQYEYHIIPIVPAITYELFYPVSFDPTYVVITDWQPTTYPPSGYNVRGPFKGDLKVFFVSGNKLTDIKLDISTGIQLQIGSVSVGISISPYKADDPAYKSPYVSVKDISGISQNWYCYWYKDNDELTYQVQFGIASNAPYSCN